MSIVDFNKFKKKKKDNNKFDNLHDIQDLTEIKIPENLSITNKRKLIKLRMNIALGSTVSIYKKYGKENINNYIDIIINNKITNVENIKFVKGIHEKFLKENINPDWIQCGIFPIYKHFRKQFKKLTETITTVTKNKYTKKNEMMCYPIGIIHHAQVVNARIEYNYRLVHNDFKTSTTEILTKIEKDSIRELMEIFIDIHRIVYTPEFYKISFIKDQKTNRYDSVVDTIQPFITVKDDNDSGYLGWYFIVTDFMNKIYEAKLDFRWLLVGFTTHELNNKQLNLTTLFMNIFKQHVAYKRLITVVENIQLLNYLFYNIQFINNNYYKPNEILENSLTMVTRNMITLNMEKDENDLVTLRKRKCRSSISHELSSKK